MMFDVREATAIERESETRLGKMAHSLMYAYPNRSCWYLALKYDFALAVDREMLQT